MPGGGWRAIRLDAPARQVTLPAGIGVDLGGLAKGLAVDAALARLRGLGLTPALISAGGDLALAGTPPAAADWAIAVPGLDRSWTIPLRGGAMATSGIARRRWRQAGRERHHLLDPRTGAPAQSGLWSATVVAGRCGQAEVAAKAAFVLGAGAGADFLEARGLSGLLVDLHGNWRAVGSWPLPAMHVDVRRA